LNKRRPRRTDAEINRDICGKHGLTFEDLKNSILEVQYFTIFSDAFPSREEQSELLEEIIDKYPHVGDISDLVTKVSISREYQGISGELRNI
jgi:hypothetical protein